MKQVVVYYIQLDGKLDKIFFNFARFFNEFGIKLVPIYKEEYQKIASHTRSYALVAPTNMAKFKALLRLRGQFLEFYVLKGHTCLFEISSFSTSSSLTRELKKGNYFYYPLPDEYGAIVENIAICIYKDNKLDYFKWPGGKSARLPKT